MQEVSVDDWDLMHDANLRGDFLTSKEAVPIWPGATLFRLVSGL